MKVAAEVIFDTNFKFWQLRTKYWDKSSIIYQELDNNFEKNVHCLFVNVKNVMSFELWKKRPLVFV